MPSSHARSTIFKDDTLNSSYHFRWASIRNLVYIIFAYSSHPSNFDLFSNIHQDVTLLNFTANALIVGMTYMSVDIFIRQYTRRLDADRYLSPVLKDLRIPLIMQSTLFALMYVRYIGDSARFLTMSLSGKPPWSLCPGNLTTSQCLDTESVIQRCDRNITRERVPLNVTSVHIYYTGLFKKMDRALITWRLFATAVAWILNFCLASVSDSIALKFYKYVLYLKVVCCLFVLTFLSISTGQGKEAFMHMMHAHMNGSIINTIYYVGPSFGVGMTGVYDFGCTSPYTIVDNAVLIFTVCFIFYAFLRSMIATILLLGVTRCIDLGNIMEMGKPWHYVLFVLLPYGSEFVYGQKLIIIYLYLHLIFTLCPSLMLYTVITSRMIHCSFPSIKSSYIACLLCIFGFCCSTVRILLIDDDRRLYKDGFHLGFTAASLYLGGMKMAIIMWVYGVRKFCTDVNFWLGFSPTMFWVASWTALPAILLAAFGYQIYLIALETDTIVLSVSLVWFCVSVLIAFGSQLKTIIHYVSINNLSGSFRNNKKYGPPDPSERRRRRMFNTTTAHRMCYHACIILDEDVDCNHMPLMNTGDTGLSSDSDSSLTQMYKETTTRTPSITTVIEVKLSKEKTA